MKFEKYEVIGFKAEFKMGIIKLTEAQARPRLHNLLPKKERGVYEIVAPIEFRRGEVIGLIGLTPSFVLRPLEEKSPPPGENGRIE